MRTTRLALLAGTASIILAGYGCIAHAGETRPQTSASPLANHVMILRLPDGQIEQVRYTGNVPPAVIVAPNAIPASAVTGDPFAMLDRISAQMDRQAETLVPRDRCNGSGAIRRVRNDPGGRGPRRVHAKHSDQLRWQRRGATRGVAQLRQLRPQRRPGCSGGGSADTVGLAGSARDRGGRTQPNAAFAARRQRTATLSFTDPGRARLWPCPTLAVPDSGRTRLRRRPGSPPESYTLMAASEEAVAGSTPGVALAL